MGKFELFQVVLPNHGRVLSGTTLTGKLQLRLKKDMEVNRIYVLLYGGATVSFEDSLLAKHNAAQLVCRYEDRETILSEHRVLYSRQDYNCVLMRLFKGEIYTFPFSFELDQDLPSSFMSNISYRVTAFFDVAGKSFECGQNIMLIQDFDLNSYCGRLKLAEPATAWHPLRHSISGNGLVTAKMVLHKKGFAIGETILVEVEIYNNTKTKLENLNLCLVQNGTLKAKGVNNSLKAERNSKLLCKNVTLGRLKPGEKISAEAVSLVVPWVVTSGLERRCRLAEVAYFLQVTTSSALFSAVTGAGAGQRVCRGPDFRKTEIVNCLCETEIVIGIRALQLPDATDSGSTDADTAPNADEVDDEALAGEAGAAVPSVQPTAPPSIMLDHLMDQDWTMFNMPSAPPSYDEATGSNAVAGSDNYADEKVPLD